MTRVAYTVQGEDGAITIAPRALAQVVLQATESIPGARARRPRRGLELTIEGDCVRISIELTAHYGDVLPELSRRVQEEVTGVVTRMCGLQVTSVDVSVEELVL